MVPAVSVTFMNRSRLRNFVLTSRWMPLLVFPIRVGASSRLVARSIATSVRWLASSREFTNYSYELTPRNRKHLAWSVSLVAGVPVERVEGYFTEIETDTALRGTLKEAIRSGDRRREYSQTDVNEVTARLGRRLGWYALVRAMQPALVVETGTDKGLGSVVLAEALIRNGSGQLITIDIEPASGMLLSERYAEVVTRVIGDSLSSLADVGPIDLFIHDSDHSAEHEESEFRCVKPSLSPSAVMISDNSHATDVLEQLSREWSRNFLFFREVPSGHWYPGGGIGMSWRTTALDSSGN